MFKTAIQAVSCKSVLDVEYGVIFFISAPLFVENQTPKITKQNANAIICLYERS